MPDSERKLIVEFMELIVAFVQTFSGQNNPRTMHECVKQYDRMKEIINQIESGGDLNPAGQKEGE